MFDRSPLLQHVPGLIHGFTDREGGVSVGRYATLNMGSKWGDDVTSVAENLRRVGETAGFDGARLCRIAQVHGVDVHYAGQVDASTKGDGLWCRRGDGHVVGVLTADCVPIVVADIGGTVAAVVHSGWRGTAAGIVRHAVSVLVANGVAAANLVAAVGPCISVDAFEVGPEVAEAFAGEFVRTEKGRPHVDLRRAVAAQLMASGVEAGHIDQVGGCTLREPKKWFSYRRDGAGIGQMLAFAGFHPGEST